MKHAHSLTSFSLFSSSFSFFLSLSTEETDADEVFATVYGDSKTKKSEKSAEKPKKKPIGLLRRLSKKNMKKDKGQLRRGATSPRNSKDTKPDSESASAEQEQEAEKEAKEEEQDQENDQPPPPSRIQQPVVVSIGSSSSSHSSASDEEQDEWMVGNKATSSPSQQEEAKGKEEWVDPQEKTRFLKEWEKNLETEWKEFISVCFLFLFSFFFFGLLFVLTFFSFLYDMKSQMNFLMKKQLKFFSFLLFTNAL